MPSIRCLSAAVSPAGRSNTITAGASSPPGYFSTASSALTDSALPGRNDEVSFFCAFSNLPAWVAAPM